MKTILALQELSVVATSDADGRLFSTISENCA